jgi:hypothetical protein
MKLVRLGLVFGFVIWAAATAFFVPLGHYVLGPENRLPVWLSVALIVAATFAGVYAFALRAFGRDEAPSLEQGALLGVAACLPGLILDGTLYAFNVGRYPGLDGPASGAMCAGLLLAYAAALLATQSAARVRSASRQNVSP